MHEILELNFTADRISLLAKKIRTLLTAPLTNALTDYNYKSLSLRYKKYEHKRLKYNLRSVSYNITILLRKFISIFMYVKCSIFVYVSRIFLIDRSILTPYLSMAKARL